MYETKRKSAIFLFCAIPMKFFFCLCASSRPSSTRFSASLQSITSQNSINFIGKHGRKKCLWIDREKKFFGFPTWKLRPAWNFFFIYQRFDLHIFWVVFKMITEQFCPDKSWKANDGKYVAKCWCISTTCAVLMANVDHMIICYWGQNLLIYANSLQNNLLLTLQIMPRLNFEWQIWQTRSQRIKNWAETCFWTTTEF